MRREVRWKQGIGGAKRNGGMGQVVDERRVKGEKIEGEWCSPIDRKWSRGHTIRAQHGGR